MILYTAAEIAELLKLKSCTILKMFDTGALPGIVLRQGARKRVIRFRQEDIDKFLNARASRNVSK